MDELAIGLRIVHIGSGVMWVGGAALFFLYIEPTINKLGPDAETFVAELVGRRKLPVYFMIVSTLTVLAGVILYWRSYGIFDTSGPGLAFGVGGLAAIVAWLGGNLLIPRSLNKLSAIGAEMKAAAGPPSGELMARMQTTQERLRLVGLIDLILLGFAVVTMAVGRNL